MKTQERLNAPESVPRIEGMRTSPNYGFSTRQKNVLKKWYPLYLCTLAAVVLCVTLLLLFGVKGNGRPISEGTVFASLADKISSAFAWIDFPASNIHVTNNPSTDAIIPPSTNQADPPAENTQKPSEDVPTIGGSIYDFDYSLVPKGYTPIIPMDLSLKNYGSSYINNSTGYSPDIISLINKNLKKDNGVEPMSVTDKPLVLIIHTHGTEGYYPEGAVGAPEGEQARTSDTEKNVVAVGKTVADILNKNGVPTAHCTVMHDSIQYKDSYARAEETIKKYLAQFPSIKLVIDIHRDSVIKSSGEIVRPVAELDGKSAAQLMCVVGSDWEGEKCPNWENNLSLALKLREMLNSESESLCRPVYLKSHTYNQEIAPYSLLIEVGAEGNSLSEAQRSAELLAQKLCELVKQI